MTVLKIEGNNAVEVFGQLVCTAALVKKLVALKGEVYGAALEKLESDPRFTGSISLQRFATDADYFIHMVESGMLDQRIGEEIQYQAGSSDEAWAGIAEQKDAPPTTVQLG